MKNMKFLKAMAFAAALSLAAQNGAGTISAAEKDEPGSENIIDAQKEFSRDIEITTGRFEPFDAGTELTGNDDLTFSIENEDIARLARKLNYSSRGFIFDFTDQPEDEYDYFYGVSEGETTYYFKDKDGKVVSTGKITVKADKPYDPALVKTGAKPVKFCNKMGDGVDTMETVYVLYDNGELWTYEGGSFAKCDDNVADINTSISSETILYKDSTVKYNGQKFAFPEGIKVTETDESLKRFIGSDGCIYEITGKTEGVKQVYSVMKKYEGVKSFTDDYDLVIAENDELAVLVPSVGKDINSPVTTGLKINPVKIIEVKKLACSAFGGCDFILTDKGELISFQYWSSLNSEDGTYSDLKTECLTDTENVKELGYIDYGREPVLIFIDAEGRIIRVADGEEILPDFDYVTEHLEAWLSSYARGNEKYITPEGKKKITVTDYYYRDSYSVRDENGTERYVLGNKKAAITHVKDNYAICTVPGDNVVIFEREDGSLWKYSLVNEEFSCIEESLTVGNDDGNSSGGYTSSDVLLLNKYLYGSKDAKKDEKFDVNKDGKINLIDLICIKNKVIG